ncbi:tetratricopeptide repeat protein 21B-like [Anthonomus grandis grandis]|uniref:tetratricopeptide repeat protein 21B-like n=1 Tax=Anthonomus grandis grandis TaxID=2921223 RepID=UPI0021658CF6|nr:tetratricopeptide repeat protein 21B-like [Anthonomus grandis grandis]XP_050293242.1 tetratricopeptide repeat protein 21B-like [Anthonomus grandis grandis]
MEFTNIFYHFYHGYYHLMLNTCKDAITKNPTNITYKLYHSLALILTNRLEEGVHDLEEISQENDTQLASTIALMYGHKFLGVAGRDIFVKLDAKMKEHRKTAEAHDYYNAAFVLVTLKKTEKALDYADKAISLKSQSEFLTLKGWILLMLKSLGKNSAANIRALFEKALQLDSGDLLATLGYTECCLHLAQFQEALNVINQAVVKHSGTNTPLLQKAKIHFAAQDWEQTSDTISRFSMAEGDILYGIKLEILVGLCHGQQVKEICNSIKKFFELIKKFEASNASLVVDSSKLFTKLCARQEDVIKEVIGMLEATVQTNIDNADLVVELGYKYLMLGLTKEAVRMFKSATKIDEGRFEAFLGLSLCEYLDNPTGKQLQKQIDYLLELKDSNSSLPLHLLQAKTSENSSQVLIHLKFIYDIKTRLLKSDYYCDKYLLNLDPDFTIDVIKEYLHSIANKDALDDALDLVNLVTKACPCLSEASYLQAKLQHLKGDSRSALRTLETLPNLSSDAGLLMAQIQVNSAQYDRAAQSLETCISSNFKVRENAIFHYITGLVEKHNGNYADAIKALTTALTLSNEVSLVDKAAIYVELIDTLNLLGQTDDALKILEEATEDLDGTPEESRIVLLSVDNMLARKDVQGAIDLLGKIGRDERCYLEGRIKLADILLTYRRDRFAFLEIYQQIAQEDPSADSFVLLGDAYMKILEINEALENYEKALKEKPGDLFLVTKMGRALVETHYFKRAVDYYKKAIKETGDGQLKLQLADLYLNLREYEKGELLLLDELDNDNRKPAEVDDMDQLLYRSKLYCLLAQIQEKSGNLTYAVKSLRDSLDNKMRVKKRIMLEPNASSEEIDEELVGISMKLGEMAVAMKNNEQAVNYYKEGLHVSPNNVALLVALAKLYMQMNYLELCQQTCATILRIDPENETASVIMADIAFRKVDFDMALFHFSQLIAKQPTNWDALIRLIEISRRLGHIESCEEYLNVAEEKCVNPLKESGFIYCKAFYQWHSGNLNSALRNFNQVRQDTQYGTDALYNMIEICLNPDGEMLAEQFMDSDDIEYRDSRSLALKTAERLIKELKQRLETNSEDPLKARLLTDFRMLATKEKYNIERALEDFVSIASQNGTKEHLGAILGMATAYTLLKQQQRAKNQLKRVVKNPWNFEDAEYLERCWLLLADQYIQSNKLESANELISKVVQHNKACVKAFEYLGYIGEKEHRFKEAANNYQQAWNVGQKSNANVGFKLAYCLMKCKRYPEAIDTATEVLKLNPEFPNVQRDVLDKCINNLRV